MSRRNPLGTAAILAVLCLMFAIGVVRIAPVDVPWHLATGRYILEHGAFPVTNTFSWTFPGHPLHQQYPLFQVPLALIVDHLGWSAVTLVLALSWTAVVAVWMGWAGSWRDAVQQPLLWLLVVAGVQRHLVSRPEVLTLLGLGVILVGLDQYQRGRRWGLAAVVLAQWAMVNSHQMWPLGLAVQASFLIHLGLVRGFGGRFGIDGQDRTLPFAPPAAALVASIAALAVSPLGLGVYLAPLTTLDTLLSQGQSAGAAQAVELRPVWSDPLSAGIAAVLVGTALLWLVRARRRIVPFDLAVFAMGTLLILIAIRGMPFVALAAGTVASRARSRCQPLVPDGSPVRATSALVALLLAVVFGKVLLSTPPAYFKIQRGFGRSLGEWGDGVVAFLRADPPPGEMLNLGWVVGNPMIFGLYPTRSVFVDPRWEAYPRPFLLEAIAALDDGTRLAALIAKYHPGFVVAEMRLPAVQQRVAELREDGWALVYVDTEHVVLVAPGTAAYQAVHPPLTTADIAPTDWLVDQPVLLAQQQVRVARLLVALGDPDRAQPLLDAARTLADNPSVAQDLATVGSR